MQVFMRHAAPIVPLLFLSFLSSCGGGENPAHEPPLFEEEVIQQAPEQVFEDPVDDVAESEPIEESVESSKDLPLDEEVIQLSPEVVFEDPVEEPVDFESLEGDPSYLSDSPYDEKAFNDVIGLGGRSGGLYGRRFAGRAAAPEEPQRVERSFETSSYARVDEPDFTAVADDPRSTFSIDVDTASYSNVRSYLDRHLRPPTDAVRIEELLNYFAYSYAPPSDGRPFAVHAEVASCPWRPQHRLVRIALKGSELVEAGHRPRNLVFLVDVSGSMASNNKLPLAKRALKLLAESLNAHDRVAIAVYAGSEGVALESTNGGERVKIVSAIDGMRSSGSTNGAAGIELAYRLAAEGFIQDGTNRVVLITDGDFNVGVTDNGALERMIVDKAKSGVFLSVLGFGMGNYKDDRLEVLADQGNGNYAYIDSIKEAHKVLVREMRGTLVTIAKDVKIQVEFNPDQVASYRLIGYENRRLAHQDFNDDKKDAGELGYGHAVTALYEVVPAILEGTATIDPLKYQKSERKLTAAAQSGELMNVRLRYKEPDGETSRLIEQAIVDQGVAFGAASLDFRFAGAVAAFGMLLRESPHVGEMDLAAVRKLARGSVGADRYGYRTELIALIDKARSLATD